VLLNQVDEDKKAGDEGATDAGWRVLRFFQEFWSTSRPSAATAESPQSPSSSATFYLQLNNLPSSDRPPPPPRQTAAAAAKAKAVPPPLPPSSGSSGSSSGPDESTYDLIELTDAQQAMAETILGLRKRFGEGSKALTPSLRAAAVTQAKTKEVRLRGDDDGGGGGRVTVRYRDISVYTSGQALEEMRRLCNSKPLEEVYTLGSKLGSGSGGIVIKATHKVLNFTFIYFTRYTV